jgi:hypothetical protein
VRDGDPVERFADVRDDREHVMAPFKSLACPGLDHPTTVSLRTLR